MVITMRRPVKYKTRQAQKQRLITILCASVLGVGVIGGAAAAIAMTRDDDSVQTGGTTDTVATDTVSAESSSEDITDLITTDTVSDTAADDTTTPQTTPSVTETETTPIVTESDTEAPVVTEDKTPGGNTGVEDVVIDVGTTKNYKGGYLDLSDYATTAALKSAADKCKADGYTAVMVELKYDNGKLAYKSGVAEAKEYGANPSVAALSIDEIVDTLHGAGLYVTARVCALRDDLAAKGNSDAALLNTAGFRYSDGASRWISVYSEAGQDYILSLLKEMTDAGVDEIMLRDYALPRDAGTTAPAYDKNVTKEAAVGAFIGRVDAALSGTALNLEMDAYTIAAGKDATMGMDCEALAKYSDSVTADITLSNLTDGMTIGGKTIKDVDADPKKTVETVLSALDSSALNIRPLFELTGDAAMDAAQIAVAQNRGYAAYQMTAPVVRMSEK